MPIFKYKKKAKQQKQFDSIYFNFTLHATKQHFGKYSFNVIKQNIQRKSTQYTQGFTLLIVNGYFIYLIVVRVNNFFSSPTL